MDRPAAAALAAGAVLAAAATGASQGPQRPPTAIWYGLLRKPAYTPPGPVIAASWTVLEVLLIGTGYRLLRDPPSPTRKAALAGWSLTLGCLAGYPWLFFGQYRLGASSVASAAMLGSAVGMTAYARKIDRPAATMSVPLLFWLGFATVLSGDIWRRNPRLSRD